MNDEHDTHAQGPEEASSAETPRHATSDPDAKLTIAIGLIGTAIVFALIFALQALYYILEDRQIEAKIYAERPQELVDMRSRQLATLNSYGWEDREKQLVRIPVDRAMELAVEHFNNPSAAPAFFNPPAAMPLTVDSPTSPTAIVEPPPEPEGERTP